MGKGLSRENKPVLETIIKDGVVIRDDVSNASQTACSEEETCQKAKKMNLAAPNSPQGADGSCRPDNRIGLESTARVKFRYLFNDTECFCLVWLEDGWFWGGSVKFL